MRHFEIPPGTMLSGEITDKLEYKIWGDEHEAVHIFKTKDLALVVEGTNVMVIRFADRGDWMGS